MPGSPKKRARKEAAKTFINNSDATMDTICSRITAAGTLVGICREFDIHYGTINEWIQSDEGRRKRYADALEVRQQHAKELVIRELVEHRQVDVLDAFDRETGALKRLEDIPEELRRVISSMEVEELFHTDPETFERSVVGRIVKVKFYDKTRTNETLARHLKMLVDKVEHSADETLSELIAKAKLS